MAPPPRTYLPFPSGASELPVKGCAMQSWQGLEVHLWMKVLKLEMRLSWKTFSPSDRVLLWSHGSSVSFRYI